MSLTDEHVDLADWYYPNSASWVDGDWPSYNGVDIPEPVMTRIEQFRNLELFDDYELWWDEYAPEDGTILVGVMGTDFDPDADYYIIAWLGEGDEVVTWEKIQGKKADCDDQRATERAEAIRAYRVEERRQSYLTTAGMLAAVLLLIAIVQFGQLFFPHWPLQWP